MLDLASSDFCPLAKGIVHLLPRIPWLQYAPCPMLSSRHGNIDIVLVLNVLYAVLRDDLDEDTLEVDRKTSLKLLCTHAHDLETLLVVDVWVVVLVEQREAVVPRGCRVSMVRSNRLMSYSRPTTS
jgi:hypothetical protein